MTDLFGVAGRELLDRLDIPQPWRGTVDASLDLIDDLEGQIDQINRQLNASDADHPYVPLLLTVPGIGWVLAFTIAAEIGDITRFASAKKLCGYTGLCPRVNQSGEKDRRGPLTKRGPGGSGMHLREHAARFLRRLYATASDESDSGMLTRSGRRSGPRLVRRGAGVATFWPLPAARRGRYEAAVYLSQISVNRSL